MECKKEKNLRHCTCTYEPCARKGVCCECVAAHRAAGEIPACFFDSCTEKTYDRSTAAFLKSAAGRRKE